MSIVTLTKWGNSVGVRIPAHEVKVANAHLGEKFELSIRSEGGFILAPVVDPQAGWLEAFNSLADSGEDKMLLDESENDFDKDEWTW